MWETRRCTGSLGAMRKGHRMPIANKGLEKELVHLTRPNELKRICLLAINTR